MTASGSGRSAWLYERPEPVMQQAMRDEARSARRTRTAVEEQHPMGCTCGRPGCDERPSAADLAAEESR